MITLGTCTVFENSQKLTYTIYKTGSAEKHSSSDDETLRSSLQRALNAKDSAKENQGGGVYRFKINDGKGYLVYKINLNGVPNTAAIFHYHWNYNLDLPLNAN